MTIYSDTNEGEGLPLWKLFTDATGIKVNYVRGADPPLMARMVLEYRGNQKSWDIAQLGTIDKIPPQLLLPFDPPEAKNISPQARDPGRRWYGLYANYNSPAYNTQHVKASELPKSYEEFAQHKDWAGHVAIDGTDSEWLYAMYQYYGDDKADRADQGHRGRLCSRCSPTAIWRRRARSAPASTGCRSTISSISP